MRDRCEIFSDIFAHRDNYLTRIDARVKTLLGLIGLLIILSVGNIYVQILFPVFFILLLISIRIPYKIIITRLLLPFIMAGIVFILKRGFPVLIATRILAAGTLVLFLGFTTPVNRFASSLRFFKVPNIWIEVALLVYRYIFVFIERAFTIREAQKIRLGLGFRSFGVLIGSVLTKAYDQARNTYEAMRLRGYNGE